MSHIKASVSRHAMLVEGACIALSPIIIATLLTALWVKGIL